MTKYIYPPKTTMTTENPPFEDIVPIENGVKHEMISPSILDDVRPFFLHASKFEVPFGWSKPTWGVSLLRLGPPPKNVTIVLVTIASLGVVWHPRVPKPMNSDDCDDSCYSFNHAVGVKSLLMCHSYPDTVLLGKTFDGEFRNFLPFSITITKKKEDAIKNFNYTELALNILKVPSVA